MQNEDGRMEKGEERTESGIVCLKWELFSLSPFFISHFPFLVPLCLRGKINVRSPA